MVGLSRISGVTKTRNKMNKMPGRGADEAFQSHWSSVFWISNSFAVSLPFLFVNWRPWGYLKLISCKWRKNSHTDTGEWAVVLVSLFTACAVKRIQGSTFTPGLLLDFPWAVHWCVRPLLLDFSPTSLPLPELVISTGAAFSQEEVGTAHANSSFLLISSAFEHCPPRELDCSSYK